MKLSFVIPALNEERHIGACLRSIRELEPSPQVETVEILVVDNDSTDRTAAIAAGFGCTVLRVGPGRPGIARNAGADRARGDMLAFVDSDCELSREWLARLANHFHNHEVCAVGGALAKPGESATWVERSWYALAHTRSLAVEEVRWLPSFNLMVRRSAFEAVHGFDDTLVTGEDVDLGYRLSKSGKLLLDSTVDSRHLGESRSLGELFRREVWRGRGSLPAIRKHGLRLDEVRSIVVPLGFVLAIVLGAVLLVGGISNPRFTGAGVLLMAAAVVLPAAIVLSRRVSLSQFMSCWAVMAVYLCARALGLAWPMERLPRRTK